MATFRKLNKRTLFAETPVPKALMTLAIPTIISQMINLIYNMVDAFFIGRTGNRETLVPRQDHVVGVIWRQLQAAEVAGDGAVDRSGQDSRALGIRVDGVGQQVRPSDQRLIEVDEPGSGLPCDGLDGVLDVAVVRDVARQQPVVRRSEGRHPGDIELRLRIRFPQAFDEGQIVLHEVDSADRPVARVGVVDAEVDHDDVPGEGQRLLILGLLHIGAMSPPQQGRSRLPEVPDLVAVPQQRLQLSRIAVMLPVGNGHAIGDAVADTGDADFLCGSGNGQKEGQEGDEKAFHGSRICP